VHGIIFSKLAQMMPPKDRGKRKGGAAGAAARAKTARKK
jgi:hypothetical protein